MCELPDKPLLAAVPVSLATDVKDPLARIRKIHESSARIRKIHESSANTKASIGRYKAAIPTDFPLPLAPWQCKATTAAWTTA